MINLDELAERAGLHKEWFIDNPEIEKFAELIVKECCNIVNQRTQVNNPNDCLIALDIKEHFGVE